MRCVCIKILIHVSKFNDILISSNEYLYIRKSNLKFKNSSENTRGRGENSENFRTETHPPL